MKTYREIELEVRCARLEALLYKAGLLSSDERRIDVKEIYNAAALPAKVPFYALVDSTYTASPFTGWQVDLAGHPYGRAWQYHHQYRVSEPWMLPDEMLPQVFADEHARFVHSLLNNHLAIGHRKKTAS